MEAEVRNILVGMKRELSKGWIQEKLDDGENVCVYGALIRVGNCPLQVSYGPGVRGRSTSGIRLSRVFNLKAPEGKAIIAIANEAGTTWQDLALWNDADGRTVDDVVDAIDRVLLREQPLKKNARKRIKRTAVPVAS